MLWTVTPNPAIDYTYHLEKIVIGTSHRVTDIDKRPGGKGINVARVADSLGAQVTATGFVGGDEGSFLVRELSVLAPSIVQEWIQTEHSTRNSIAIVDGEATLFNEAGNPIPHHDWQSLYDLLSSRVSDGDVVCVCGSFPPEAPADTLLNIRHSLRDNNVLLIVDTSGSKLVEAASVADFIKPNEEELLASTGTSTVAEGVRVLHAQGCPLVAVSRGEKGMELWAKDWVFTAQLPYSLQGNPTGAGDAAVAAWAMSLGADPSLWSRDYLLDALINATATSAAAVTMDTAGEIDQEKRLQFFNEIHTSIQPIGESNVG